MSKPNPCGHHRPCKLAGDKMPEDNAKPCRLDFSEARRDEVVETNVNRIMNETRPPLRAEITEIIEAVFNAGVTLGLDASRGGDNGL